MYAGHLDNYIYKYYTLKLYKSYNKWMENLGIDECATAYRDNKESKSNIDFSAEVISKIVNYENTYILVGDFTKFFDKIDHRILKKNLIQVLGGNLLTKDWYNIFRSVMKYGYYKKEEINNIVGSDNQLRQKGQLSYFKSVKHFRKFQQRKKPDYKMNKIAQENNGLYRRYSDDFIVVLPKKIGINKMMK